MKALMSLFILFPFILKAQTISTVAGNGILGFSGDGGPATAAKLHIPGKAIVDKNGNMFIADSWGHRIRKIDESTGIISTIAGTGIAGYNGDNIPATSAQLYDPVGLAIDSIGNLYIGDAINERVRKIDLTTGIITTFAGNGVGAGTGWGGFSGDGGPATNASLNAPAYITIDTKGNLYIEDGKNYRVRKVSLSSNIITTVAGNGNWGYNGDGGSATAAEFNFIQGIAVDSVGNLFICDTNSTIRRVEIATGKITTVTGIGLSGYSGDGTPATSARILNPFDITFDSKGNYYIAEFKGRIRKVDGLGIIHTVAGTSAYGYNGDGIPATSAMLNETTGVSVDVCGNLYIADASNNRIRKVAFPPILSIPSITLANEPVSAPIGSTVTISATVTNAGSSYIIHWMNHGVEFTTTTVPSVTYTKGAGVDTITARVVSTASYGCYDSTTSAGHVVTVGPDGVPFDKLTMTGISIWPNPVSDELHVDDVAVKSSYRILSIVGAVMQQGVLQQGNNNLSLQLLPAGIYVIEISDPSTGLRMARKIIKQ